MQVLNYFAWGAAAFFAISWTIGLLIRANFRLKSTVVTVLFWWIEIALAVFGLYSPLHLFWLMPISLLLPGAVMHADTRTGLGNSIGSIITKSALVIGSALAILVYFSR